MRRRAVLVAAAAVLLGASSLRAQAPSFAGKWTMVPDPNAAGGGGGGGGGGRGGGGGGGFGNEFTAVQDAKTLTITRTTQNGEVKSVYNLDGSDSKNMVTGRGGQTEVVSHAKWDGSKLNISTTRDFNGTSTTTTQTLSLDASGNLLVTSQIPARGGGEATTRTVTYKKG